MLMAAGIFFYAWGEPTYIWLLMATVVFNYGAGRLLERFDKTPKLRLFTMLAAIFGNLFVLILFRFSSFIVLNCNALWGTKLVDPKLPVPIGISFYTLVAIAYILDLYRKKSKPQKNFITFATYLTLFPVVAAGPIVRYSELEGELDNREIAYKKTADGISLFIRGLGKKVLLANSIGGLWVTIKGMDYQTMSALTAWVGILAFTFQIYYSLSGYSDMAIGLGRMLGFHFPKNFDHPYMSKSILEFFRRWQITLSEWFRDYVYIPMGASTGSMKKSIFNLVVVCVLTGVWYGAGWNFLLWGCYLGVIIVIEKLFLGTLLKKLPRLLQWLYSFLLIMFGWVIFSMKTVGEMSGFFGAMFGLNGAGFFERQSFYFILTNLIVFVVCAIGSTTAVQHLFKPFEAKVPFVYKTAKLLLEFAVLIICICYLATAGYNPFVF